MGKNKQGLALHMWAGALNTHMALAGALQAAEEGNKPVVAEYTQA
jgi:hypothetical protein